MVIELKKSKITQSIVNQSTLGSSQLYINYESYNVLGWCRIKTKRGYIRYVLLYNKFHPQILKVNYIDSIEAVSTYHQAVQILLQDGDYIFPKLLHVTIKLVDLNSTVTFVQKYNIPEKYTLENCEKIKEFIRISNEKGQIYL